jgi:hypothetical protein
MQDEIDDADDGKDNLYCNIELSDTSVALLDLGGGFQHVIFFFIRHETFPAGYFS